MSSTTSAAVGKAFLENWVYAYGIPKQLLTNNGPQFTSKLFTYIVNMLGTLHARTLTYHPQTNGQAERYNHTLITRVRYYVSEHHDYWDQFIQPLTYAYNQQIHRTTGFAPFALALPYPPTNPVSALFNDQHELT